MFILCKIQAALVVENTLKAYAQNVDSIARWTFAAAASKPLFYLQRQPGGPDGRNPVLTLLESLI